MLDLNEDLMTNTYYFYDIRLLISDTLYILDNANNYKTYSDLHSNLLQIKEIYFYRRKHKKYDSKVSHH